MPTVSQFYGIQIVMRYREKHAPHFHAMYAEFSAQIVIADGAILCIALNLRRIGSAPGAANQFKISRPCASAATRPRHRPPGQV